MGGWEGQREGVNTPLHTHTHSHATRSGDETVGRG